MIKKIGIFGGSFNPIHRGHIALAKWLKEQCTFDEIWLNLSPQNPLKEELLGANDEQRKKMLTLACEKLDGIKPSFVEFDLPKPSYTVDTLKYLAKLHPDFKFSLIIGADNWEIFNKWRDPQTILNEFGVIVYPRPGYNVVTEKIDGMVYYASAPVLDISSTEIRNSTDKFNSMLPPSVAEYINKNHLYGK